MAHIAKSARERASLKKMTGYGDFEPIKTVRRVTRQRPRRSIPAPAMKGEDPKR